MKWKGILILTITLMVTMSSVPSVSGDHRTSTNAYLTDGVVYYCYLGDGHSSVTNFGCMLTCVGNGNDCLIQVVDFNGGHVEFEWECTDQPSSSGTEQSPAPIDSDCPHQHVTIRPLFGEHSELGAGYPIGMGTVSAAKV